MMLCSSLFLIDLLAVQCYYMLMSQLLLQFSAHRKLYGSYFSPKEIKREVKKTGFIDLFGSIKNLSIPSFLRKDLVLWGFTILLLCYLNLRTALMVAFNYFYIKKAHMAYEYKRIKTKDDLKEFIAADRQGRDSSGGCNT